jgi:hypothetical protein
MPDAAAITTEIGKTSELIDAFRLRTGEGHLIDLSGLDDRVMDLCKNIEHLPPVESAPLKPIMLVLIDNLNSLVDAIREQHAMVRSDLKAVTSREKAVSAYGSASTTSNEPDRS